MDGWTREGSARRTADHHLTEARLAHAAGDDEAEAMHIRLASSWRRSQARNRPPHVQSHPQGRLRAL